MKTPTFILLIGALLLIPFLVDAQEPQFKSPAAIQARDLYQKSVVEASKRLIDELDRNMKFALQNGALEEANQINEAKKQAAAGMPVTVDLKPANLVSARDRHRDALKAAKGEYFRDLEPVLRDATRRGDLAEANLIDSIRKAIEAELADGTISGNLQNGLWLTIGNNRQLWENKAIMLPSNQTPVKIVGVLQISGKARTVKLRSAKASGSERLRFTVDGQRLEFEMEGSHRFVTATPKPGADQLRLSLGDSIAANEWLFGPLEWSINDGNWREIPIRSLIAVD
ncbi:MAG: hypothetical protein JNK37_11870 [Verrucomicrobiales bacterium]|nr:hypothetical protein [Verrucomicrobiales bacterium]